MDTTKETNIDSVKIGSCGLLDSILEGKRIPWQQDSDEFVDQIMAIAIKKTDEAMKQAKKYQ